VVTCSYFYENKLLVVEIVKFWLPEKAVPVQGRLQVNDFSNGGFRVGGARGKTEKGGPQMISSYSANRDNHF